MTSAIADRAAIDKAISLLASFRGDVATGVGVSELARRAQLNKSTAYRVLALLERNRVVERVGTNYRLGSRLHDLGGSAYSSNFETLRDRLIPFVTELYVATQETVHLTALQGPDVVYLAKLYGHRQPSSPSRIGGRIPAHCTAAGKVLLAHSPVEAELVLNSSLMAYTRQTITDTATLGSALINIRRTGVAIENGEIQRGLSCIAVPIFGDRSRVLAALSISGASDRLNTRRWEPILRRVSNDASRALRCFRNDQCAVDPEMILHKPA
ncbi:IclR family transcriptional regulator [Rhodococcus sp. KBW08]|uniref:IclR family transcriptional regulator n=1 Tax=Rhodococcus sp. KBW08 TaxID=2144188 RepID=UPI000F597308|nr:IclR family transcriptional regulator [Rhodococcus sp. KBW08]RQO46079.1 IclR family transcriptional regulator [Rhodococcus sp. KBW08]